MKSEEFNLENMMNGYPLIYNLCKESVYPVVNEKEPISNYVDAFVEYMEDTKFQVNGKMTNFKDFLFGPMHQISIDDFNGQKLEDLVRCVNSVSDKLKTKNVGVVEYDGIDLAMSEYIVYLFVDFLNDKTNSYPISLSYEIEGQHDEKINLCSVQKET